MIAAVTTQTASRIADVLTLRCTATGDIVTTTPRVAELIGTSILASTTPLGADVLRSVETEHGSSGAPVRFKIPLVGPDGRPDSGSFEGVAEWDESQRHWLIRRL